MAERITHCPDPERWMARITANYRETPDGCWQWTFYCDRYGYGRFAFSDPDGRKHSFGAHRAAWLAWRGDILDDLVVDHLCRNRACVNPAHMELVTMAENTRRGFPFGHSPGRPRTHPDDMHCGRHGREDGWVAVLRTGYMRWTCRICARERRAKSIAKALRRREADQQA